MAAQTIERAWLSKTLAGVVLGLTLALGCCAVFARVVTGLPPMVLAQLTMWMLMPIWLSVLGSVYFFPSGKRAWLSLGAANLVVAALVVALRSW